MQYETKTHIKFLLRSAGGVSVVIVHSYLVDPPTAEPARRTTGWSTERQVNTASQGLVDWRLFTQPETMTFDL